ncbi:hypothetical protein V1460_36025 [Streptomyces sp. SCSIO 30461]|uniref:hypothetical protein n=1 Tax=Streptomyces sp. SCSIO 30461 TaxID=3118085 RepID=UPI0030CB1F31
MTEQKGRWERQGLIPASRREPGAGAGAARAGVRPGTGPGVAERGEEPIYASLLAQWSAQGKTVPGPDHEWTAIVSRSCWPRW